jgi:hypothetical protein
MLGTDTITLFKKQPDGSFSRFVVSGVQWSDKDEVVNPDGRVNVSKYASVTFFAGTFENLDLTNFSSEDAVFYGVINNNELVDNRISPLLKRHPKSGIIKSVKDNSNRDYLKNIKVVLV